MIQEFITELKKTKVNVIPLVLAKKFFSTDIEVLYFPNTGKMVLFLPLSNEGEDKWRIQPFNKTLIALREARDRINNIELVCYNDDLKEVVVVSDLSFLQNYEFESDEGRRSIRISKLTSTQIRKVKKGEIVELQTNALQGTYSSIKNYIAELKKNAEATVSANGIEASKEVSSSDVYASNIVLYGPPGTGKTRGSILISNQLLAGTPVQTSASTIQSLTVSLEDCSSQSKNWYSVQFHPSFSYEDFFEGLRPVNQLSEGKNEISYEIVPGVFKITGELARATFEPGEYGIKIEARLNSDNLIDWLREGQSHVAQYRFLDRDGYFKFNDKVVLTTGSVDNKIDETEGLPKNEKINLYWYSSAKKPEQFVLFIDELNRGNPSRIFGEALSLIETSKRIGGSEPTYLRLPYSHEKFALTPNFNVLCAMNSSDKSLAHLDQAFRRRFKFIYLGPNFELIRSKEFKKEIFENLIADEFINTASGCFAAINSALESLEISIDNHIGHSYCIDLLNKLKFVIRNKGDDNASSTFKTLFSRLWKNELHLLVRDIIGEYKIDEFVENFFVELDSKKISPQDLGFSSNAKGEFKKFLKSANPEENIGAFEVAA
jgi:hypothetical protein